MELPIAVMIIHTKGYSCSAPCALLPVGRHRVNTQLDDFGRIGIICTPHSRGLRKPLMDWSLFTKLRSASNISNCVQSKWAQKGLGLDKMRQEICDFTFSMI
jgi:hypothetical protein